MAKKKKTVRKTKTPPKELYFVEMSAKSCKFGQLVALDGTLYGLDESGRCFAYVDGEGWYQVENDNRRFLVGNKRETTERELPGTPPNRTIPQNPPS